MVIRILFCLVLLLADRLCAQTPSGIIYPIAQCNGGTCPPNTTVKSHITCSFIDTLTETFYTAGQFRTLGTQTRIGIGAMNAATGVLLPFAPVIDTFGCIYAMSMKGDTLFVGGRFTSVNGQPRVNFAAIRASTGQLLPAFSGGIGGSGDTVFAITVYRGRIYVGGKFTSVFSTPRTNIARLSYSGTVNAWNPTGVGVVRKALQWRSQLVLTADLGLYDQRLVKVDTLSALVVQLRATINSAFNTPQSFQDFVTRNDTLYVVGNFDELDVGFIYDFIAINLTTGLMRPWSLVIPRNAFNSKSRTYIEHYRDSLYIGTTDASTQNTDFHKLYVVHYRGSTLRVLKTYGSNILGLNGYFCSDIVIGNARMVEVERFAYHTVFPNGSFNCEIFSWCLKIPITCGSFLTGPNTMCPNDSAWFSVRKDYYYSTHVWSASNGSVTLIPFDDSCLVITSNAFAFATIRVKGVTSCGIQSASFQNRAVTALPLPIVSAGPDDTLSCITTSLHLFGSCTPAPISWSWSGPSTTSNADSIFVTDPGMYYLQCVAPNGCKQMDSAFVFADTIPPAILPFPAVQQLTCTNTSVALNASTTYPADSLRWTIGASSFANPTTTALPGTVYLTITDRSNGCSSVDTISITQNITTPSGVALYSDSILTCSRDSILLTGFSLDTNVIFVWMDSSLTILQNPYYVTSSGYFALYAIDTSNGCSSSPDGVVIFTWYTPPSVIVATDSFNINCSYDSVLLVGSSLTLASTSMWTDSLSYTSVNPAMTGTQGMYYFAVTDTLNGCSAVDSAYVGFQATLEVNASNDTVICPGSGAVLNVMPIGGTPAFQYAWNNLGGNLALTTVYPSDTLTYIVNVIDGAGCTGSDTVIVNVPDVMQDSVLAFQPCDPLQPTGQIQIYPWGGVPPYQFSNDGGLTWQLSNIFASLNYGTYQFVIQDAIGCTRNTSASIDTNSLSPAPEFLVSTSPSSGDTIVIVDISNPRPDSVIWDFPLGTTIVDTSMFSPSIVPADTGSFFITMHAWYGTCEVNLTRQISIEPFDTLDANQWNANAIDSLVLYPNPNNGIFNVHVELQSQQNFVVLIIDDLGNERGRTQVIDSDNWTGQMSVINPVPGSYILRVVAEFDSAELIFIITQ